MRRKFRAARFRLSEQHCQEPWQVRKVPDEQNVAGLADEPIAEPVRRVAWLQIFGR